jgi:nondiscriminating glutamyl-tRNA synthetase
MNLKPRVRFAPSPTGSLHLGGARTALYNYLFATNQGGTFIVRVEDTDTSRSTEASMQTQLEDLAWLGLDWSEGVDAQTLEDRGDYAPYRQSQRLKLYQKYVTQLLEQDQAYYCFLTDDEITAQKEAAKAKGSLQHVVSPYREQSLDKARTRLAAGETATVRFKCSQEDKTYAFKDIVRKEVKLPSHMVGDFVIQRSSGMPVYNFCCVIDDHLMKITHVFRGEEHLSNSLRQLMLYEALEMTPPVFGHLSVILGENKKKLSKRDQAVCCADFRQQGYLPQAVLNAIALLGWTDPKGRDIMSLDELIEAFNSEDLNASSAIFDLAKLNWINQQHIKRLSCADFWQQLLPCVKEAGLQVNEDEAWRAKVHEVIRHEMVTLKDAIPLLQPLCATFALSSEASEVLSWPETKVVLTQWVALLQAKKSSYLSEDEFTTLLSQVKEQAGVKGKQLFMPLRVAVIGKPHGAELKLLVPLLTTEVMIARAQACLQ